MSEREGQCGVYSQPVSGFYATDHDDNIDDNEILTVDTCRQATPASVTNRTLDSDHSDTNDLNESLEVCEVNDVAYLQKSVPEISSYFDIVSKVGEGTFSSVYMATIKDCPSVKVALKHLTPTSSAARTCNEVKCLHLIGGRDNVVPLKACLRHRDHVVLVMPYIPHEKFPDVLLQFTAEDIRLYMQALFRALAVVHSHRIIHRDIKPSNFLFHRTSKLFQLIDFGLAHFQHTHTFLMQERTSHQRTQYSRKSKAPIAHLRDIRSNKRSTIKLDTCSLKHNYDEVCRMCMERTHQTVQRAGTPGFRAPEVLLKHLHQTTAIDIWSAGVIMLCLLSGCYPFFYAKDDKSALAQIIGLMGSRECSAAAQAIGKELICEPAVRPVDLKELCISLRGKTQVCPSENISPNILSSHETKDTVTSEDSSKLRIGEGLPDSAYHLLYQCLDLNPFTRITAHQALSHPFIVGNKI